MSFKAVLLIDDLRINVLYAEYTFRQHINKDYFPVQRPQAGFIEVHLESTVDTTLLDWSLSPTQIKSGKIIFYKRDNQSKLKELIFSDGYCVSFQEKFTATGLNPFYIKVKISAGALKQGQSEYLNPWYESKGVEGEEEKGAEQERYGEKEENSNVPSTFKRPNNEFRSKKIGEFSGIENSIRNGDKFYKAGNFPEEHLQQEPNLITDSAQLSQIKSALEEQKKMLERRKLELDRWNEQDQDCFKKVFGKGGKDGKKLLKNKEIVKTRIEKQISEVDDFLKDETYKKKFYSTDEDCFAEVYSSDKDHKIYLGKDFWTANETGEDSKPGVLVHEMSHFRDLGGTDDVEVGGETMYGKEYCEELASNPRTSKKAIKNADNFEYYVERSICE